MDPLIWAFILTTALGIGMASLLVWAIGSVHRERTRAAVNWGRRLLNAQGEERRVIARELHDGVVPAIESLGLLFRRHGVPEGSERASTTALQVRTISHGLHPSILNHLTLVDGVRQLIATESSDRLQITLAHGELPMLEFAPRLAAFRIVQEAVRNADRHAGASLVEVRIDAVAEAIDITIRDDGAGFVVPADTALDTLGLRSMRERALALGGTLTIVSAPGIGTTVHAHLPIGAP